MDYSSLIEKRLERLRELEDSMSRADFFSDQKKASETMREHGHLKKLMDTWEAYKSSRKELEDSRELAKGEDPEMAELAELEIPRLEERVEKLRLDIQYSLLPRDEMEDRDAIVEIRAGTGGDEASLFAGDLLRMYERYAERKGWKFEPMESSPSEVGGFKEVVCRISGSEVFRFMKYESGVHRVQRVPETEAQGRIHTSTATVAVLPEAEEVDIEIRPEDLHLYAPYVETIKLSTRDAKSPWTILKAYTEQSYSGNVFDFIDPGFSQMSREYWLDNSAFPPDWAESGTAGLCAGNCTHCGKCEQVLEKVLKHTTPSFSVSGGTITVGGR